VALALAAPAPVVWWATVWARTVLGLKVWLVAPGVVGRLAVVVLVTPMVARWLSLCGAVA
jgi:hypothetical protein